MSSTGRQPNNHQYPLISTAAKGEPTIVFPELRAPRNPSVNMRHVLQVMGLPWRWMALC